MKSTRRVRYILAVVGTLGLLLAALVGCSRESQVNVGGGPVAPGATAGPAGGGQEIRQVGSTTVLPIAEKWAKAFHERNAAANLSVAGGGSGTGIKALIGKTADLADSSRTIKPEEIQQAQAGGVTPKEFSIAYDGIAIIVNPANPVNELSVEQLSDIYAGSVSKWSAVGAPGLGDLVVVARDSASGTFESFKELVVTKNGQDKSRDYRADALQQASNEGVLTTVAQTKSAIGYVGLGYVNTSVKVIGVIPLGGGAAVKPSEQTVRDGTYPIGRRLYVYTNGEPTGILKEYLDWGLGPEGQALVREAGYIPLQ